MTGDQPIRERLESVLASMPVPTLHELFDYQFDKQEDLVYEDSDIAEMFAGKRYDEIDCIVARVLYFSVYSASPKISRTLTVVGRE